MNKSATLKLDKFIQEILIEQTTGPFKSAFSDPAFHTVPGTGGKVSK